MNTLRPRWARINASWPESNIHHPLEARAHTDGKSKELYSQFVEAGHPDPETQSKFLYVPEVLGLKDSYVLINRQHPGQQVPMHVDLGSASRYHYMTRAERYEKLERCFVFLDDWQPGQVVQMQSEMIKNWKCGDVLWYDWRTMPHGTANFGKKVRPLLLITGVATARWQEIHLSNQLTEFDL